jgi:hypothetical protein
LLNKKVKNNTGGPFVRVPKAIAIQKRNTHFFEREYNTLSKPKAQSVIKNSTVASVTAILAMAVTKNEPAGIHSE